MHHRCYIWSSRHWLSFSIMIAFPTIIVLLIKSQNTRNVSIHQFIFGTSERKSISGIRCIVYVDYCEGRLGNKMFLVASAYGIARLHSCHAHISSQLRDDMKSIFVLNLSPISLSAITLDSYIQNQSDSKKRVIKDSACEYFHELSRPNAISRGTVLKLTGYWQSYLHFAKYDDELRNNVFGATRTVVRKVSQFFTTICQQKINNTIHFSTDEHKILKKQLTNLDKTTWIGVHVRRSDFLLINFSSPDTYLFTAMDYFNDQYPDAQFIIASDDKLYCQQLFRNRSNVFITPFSFSAGEDLITLSMCEHSIVTGGSFGWWSAYLANGHVVHDSIYRSGCVRQEQYFPPWFLIDHKS